MNIKQFKKKLLYGLIEPELFYMPVKKETATYQFMIRLLTYKQFYLSTNTYGNDITDFSFGFQNTYVIYTLSNKKVAMIKGYMATSIELKQGKYKIKIIHSNGAKLDNKWHYFTVKPVDNITVNCLTITLEWQDWYKVQVLYHPDETIDGVSVLQNKEKIHPNSTIRLQSKGFYYYYYSKYNFPDIICKQLYVDGNSSLSNAGVSSNYYEDFYAEQSSIYHVYPIVNYAANIIIERNIVSFLGKLMDKSITTITADIPKYWNWYSGAADGQGYISRFQYDDNDDTYTVQRNSLINGYSYSEEENLGLIKTNAKVHIKREYDIFNHDNVPIYPEYGGYSNCDALAHISYPSYNLLKKGISLNTVYVAPLSGYITYEKKEKDRYGNNIINDILYQFDSEYEYNTFIESLSDEEKSSVQVYKNDSPYIKTPPTYFIDLINNNPYGDKTYMVTSFGRNDTECNLLILEDGSVYDPDKFLTDEDGNPFFYIQFMIPQYSDDYEELIN